MPGIALPGIFNENMKFIVDISNSGKLLNAAIAFVAAITLLLLFQYTFFVESLDSISRIFIAFFLVLISSAMAYGLLANSGLILGARENGIYYRSNDKDSDQLTFVPWDKIRSIEIENFDGRELIIGLDDQFCGSAGALSRPSGGSISCKEDGGLFIIFNAGFVFGLNDKVKLLKQLWTKQ